MLLLTRIITGLLAAPIGYVIFLATLGPTLRLLADPLWESSLFLVGACGYLSLLGFVTLLNLTYSNRIESYSPQYIYLSLASGLTGLLLSLVIFSFHKNMIVFSAIILTLSAYQMYRWQHACKTKGN